MDILIVVSLLLFVVNNLIFDIGQVIPWAG